MRALVLATLACCAAATPAAASPLVNLALTAKSTSAAAATDGNAATSACVPEVTVDLGQTRRLEGFGVSLAGDAASGHVVIEAAGRQVGADMPIGTATWVRGDPVSAR